MVQKATQLMPLSPYAAFLIRNASEKVLVISDLHIGWEVALAQEGVHVPSQTPRLLEKLRNIVGSEKFERLLILGDVKHTVAKIEHEEWRDVPWFLEKATRIVRKVQIVPGNHDGDIKALLPETVETLSPRGTIIGDVGLFHGHTWPDVGLLGCRTLVVGHVHPVVVFKDPMGFRITRQVWLRAPCNGELLAKFVLRRSGVKLGKKQPREILRDKYDIDLRAENLVIMPAFNDFLGGQAINRSSISRRRRFREFIGPVLRSGSINFEKAETYLLDGTFLGSLDRLMSLS